MKIVLLQTAIGDYRQTVLNLLIQRLGDDFHAFAGEEYFDPTTRTRVSLGSNLTIIKNHFLAGRRLLWQSGFWSQFLRADVAILELNPRILSVWLALFVRKLLRKKSVLWGHAWSRRGPHARSDYLRHLMRKLGNSIIAYTETEAQQLRDRMPKVRIIAAPNALYSARAIGPVTADSLPHDFIFVGRLIAAKKPMLLLEAFLAARCELPAGSALIFVGDGPLLRDLQAVVTQSKADEFVKFTGHVSDLANLRVLYARALASVSPGYVGLSIIQSFSFGVPMIIAREESHAPEIEAAIEGENCYVFDADSRDSLARALIAFSEARDYWIACREAVAQYCAAHYSAEVMADRILEAVST